jgi:N-acetylglucosamine-6-phosphate deacetylase
VGAATRRAVQFSPQNCYNPQYNITETVRTIDIHTHGFGKYDTRTGDPDDILAVARLHGSSGVDAIVAAVYPAPPDTMRCSMAAIQAAMEYQRRDASSADEEKTATILGIHLEGPFLNPDMAGALDKNSFLDPTIDNYMRLADGLEDAVRVVTIAPELDGSPELIRFLSDRGITVSMGHSNATYSEAEAGYRAGARGVTHVFNAMRGIHHREPGIAGFALMVEDVYVEVIADPYHLSDRLIEFIFRTKDPGRIVIVSDMVRMSSQKAGDEALRDDTGRLAGGSMTITQAAARLRALGIEQGRIDRAIRENPERYLALSCE